MAANTREIRLLYENDREEALRTLREAGIAYRESTTKARKDSLDDWQRVQRDFRSMMTEVGRMFIEGVSDAATRTASEIAGQGGIGAMGEQMAEMVGSWVGRGLTVGLKKTFGDRASGWADGLEMFGSIAGVQLAQSFARYETIRMLGARRAAQMGQTGAKDFYKLGQEYTLRSNEIQTATGLSAQAVDALVVQLSRVGIKFDEVGKEAIKYAGATDILLNLQEGTAAGLEEEAVKRYGEAWQDVTDVIQSTTSVQQYWQAVSERTGDASAKALAANQNLLDMYKQVREATRGTAFSMTGLNKLFLASADVMHKAGLRPEMIAGLTGEFISKIAPQTTSFTTTIQQGFFIRDLLNNSEAGRKINSVVMGIAQKEGLDPILSNVALTSYLSSSSDATSDYARAFLESLSNARDGMPGNRENQNMLLTYKMSVMTGMSPMAGHLTIALADEYKKKLDAGLSPADALKEAGQSDAVSGLAGAMGFKGMSSEEILKRMMPIADASRSTEQKLALAAERLAAIHAPDRFWPSMASSIAEGMKRVAGVANAAAGAMDAPGAEAAIPPSIAPFLPAAEKMDTGAMQPAPGHEAAAQPRRLGRPTLVGSYSKSGAGGVQQVDISVESSYFGPNIDAIAQGIANIESRGQKDPYKAVGPVTHRGDRAIGKYQIMGRNVPTWTKQALGKSMTPEEFAANPAAQEATAKFKMAQYYERYGTAGDVASMWHAGIPLDRAIAQQRRDILGTKTSDYSRHVSEYVDSMRARG